MEPIYSVPTWANLAASLGFPVAVTIYLLVSLKRELREDLGELRTSVNTLAIVISQAFGINYEQAKRVAGQHQNGG